MTLKRLNFMGLILMMILCVVDEEDENDLILKIIFFPED